MNSLFITLLIGGATGVLLGTAGAKIWAAARTRLAWPEGANFLRFHLSSNFVIAAEIVVSAIALAVPGYRIVSLLLAIIYAGFVVGATTLKGQECGCFGIEGMKVGSVHIWGCALTAAVLLASAAGNEEITSPRLLRLVVALASAVVMTVAMHRGRRHQSRSTLHHSVSDVHRVLCAQGDGEPRRQRLRARRDHSVGGPRLRADRLAS